MLRDEPIFCCPREPQAAKHNQWTFLDFTPHSYTVSQSVKACFLWLYRLYILILERINIHRM